MESASKIYKKNLIGLILTGMGKDGMVGSKKIKENGGTVIVQSIETSIIPAMPKATIDNGYYDEIVALQEISVALLQVLEA